MFLPKFELIEGDLTSQKRSQPLGHGDQMTIPAKYGL